MKLVLHLLLAVAVPSVDHAGLGVPHVHDAVVFVEALAVLFSVPVQFTVDQVDRILFISRP